MAPAVGLGSRLLERTRSVIPLQPQRLDLPIRDRAPDPFHRAVAIAIQPPRRNHDLHGDQRECAHEPRAEQEHQQHADAGKNHLLQLVHELGPFAFRHTCGEAKEFGGPARIRTVNQGIMSPLL